MRVSAHLGREELHGLGGRPGDRHTDQIGPTGSRRTPAFGEAAVVADQHRKPQAARLMNGDDGLADLKMVGFAVAPLAARRQMDFAGRYIDLAVRSRQQHSIAAPPIRFREDIGTSSAIPVTPAVSAAQRATGPSSGWLSRASWPGRRRRNRARRTAPATARLRRPDWPLHAASGQPQREVSARISDAGPS